ncbi:efflux RND transporter periplasmic adaptor subunit [Thiococcus pfennigii]|uniref:efflux RND transporter periplasmic adaptor subunit n=1 Tax=Thiococcus pfennigii TaxID=1057 RepID=UPI001908D6A6|nr:efflux RND transporter periplasmic adaptor subunit [Thiococcus pfennigii]MBK1730546.1 hypothetical protein [Thiococcus pfennigii]
MPIRIDPLHRQPWILFVAVLAAFGPARAAAPAQGAPVAVGRADQTAIVREVTVTGTVTSPRTAALSTQVAGMVTRLTVDAGDRVARGDLLVELDREVAAFTLATVQAETERATAALADAQRRLGEARALVGDGGFSQSEVETLAAEVTMAQAALTAAEAEAHRQAAVVARYRVTAPFAGVVAERVAELGEWITPGTRVLELVAIDGLRFDFRVPQELYPLLGEATPVTVWLDALPGQPFVGRVQAIVPVSDPRARTFLLRVLPAEALQAAITPGMSAHATLRIDTGRRGVVVPRDALLRYPDGRVSVWRLDRSGEAPRVREQRVTPGLAFGERIEIREGLEADAPVIVEGNEALQDGQVVRVRDSAR